MAHASAPHGENLMPGTFFHVHSGQFESHLKRNTDSLGWVSKQGKTTITREKTPRATSSARAIGHHYLYERSLSIRVYGFAWYAA